jgi:CoA:oxalate CoA-transferase
LKSRALPLEGIRVIELCQAFSGPITGLYLADLGAEIIKVERPQLGDECRHYGPDWIEEQSLVFMALNRNKKSLTLDLKNSRGREIFLSLVKRADVLTENFRPGTMERLGLGYETISRENPSIVYCSFSAYGQKGPLCKQPGYEAIMQAFTGIMSFTGEEGGQPLRTGFSVLDSTSGILFAFAITTALLDRQRTNKGRYLEATMMDAALSLTLHPHAAYFNLKRKPKRFGNKSAYGAPSKVFRTSTRDIMVFMLNDRLWQQFCHVIGKPEWAECQEFKTAQDRLRNRERLSELLGGVLETKSAEEWIALLRHHQLPCSPINEISDFVESDQSQTRVTSVLIDHPIAGKLKLPRLPILDAQYGPMLAEVPPPLLGEHNNLILGEYLGLDTETIKDLQEQGII